MDSIMNNLIIKKLITKVMKPFQGNSLYNNRIPMAGLVYKENQEIGCKNLSEKMKRLENGGPFEWPNMVSLNKSLQEFIKDSKRVVVIGSGTGTFEWYAANNDEYKDILFVTSEFDEECVQWCKDNRAMPNIEYTSLSISELITTYGKFDLAILVDVIEHIKDYAQFMQDFLTLADEAIITTPNKDRNLESSLSISPTYYQHVREWNAGEFFWIMRCFYSNVNLYAMPDIYTQGVDKIGLMSTMTPLIAHCSNKSI
jgi:2-polyprenyl-3-methyl-5-hydroxy-6-metoxy-1,4-benzoquinol methylase